MQSNGTIGFWRVGKDGSDIIFPEAEIDVRGETKLRGGAPVCCPNFGPAPTEGPYKGVTLPQHGLVRNCRIADGKVAKGNPAMWQQAPTLREDGWFHAGFVFTHPWSHEAWVAAKTEMPESGVHRMHHRISLGTESIHDVDMPYSIGFHPYFATEGNDLRLRCGDMSWTVREMAVGESIHVTSGNVMVLEGTDRTITVELTEGYNGFYVWTDRPDLYVCVEPVCLGNHKPYRMLLPGDVVSCACTLTYSPQG